jgi:hypothetical protein
MVLYIAIIVGGSWFLDVFICGTNLPSLLSHRYRRSSFQQHHQPHARLQGQLKSKLLDPR